MELKLTQNTVTAASRLCDTKLELPIETEILIPDYMPEVFKIIKTFVYPIVLQKQIQAERLLLDGYFRVEIFYQGDDQHLCSMEQKVPFSKQMECKNAESEQEDIWVNGEVQYINCRAVNQRRLDVRGAYQFSISILAMQPREVITGMEGMDTQYKTDPVKAVEILRSPEKQFTVEEDILLEGNPETVLHTENVPYIREVKTVSDRVVIRGVLESSVIYRNENGLQKVKKELEFNQIVDMKQVKETDEFQVSVSPIGCTISAAEGETSGYWISVTCILSVRAMRQKEFTAVTDAFSTGYQEACTYKEMVMESLMERLTNKVEVKTQGTLQGGNIKILDCFATCFTPELAQQENTGETLIQGKAVAHLICMNELGEIECYDKICEYTLPKKYAEEKQNLDAFLTARCVSIHAVKNDEFATAELEIQVQGYVLKKDKIQVLEQMECKEPIEKDEQVALRIYYADQGERVFDIAKRYHASPEQIAELAGMKADVLDNSCRLLIPMMK